MAQLKLITRVPTQGEITGINSSVVGHWRFQGDATDEDASGSDLTINTGNFAHALVSEHVEGAWIGGIPASRRNYGRLTVDASLQIDGNLTISTLFTHWTQGTLAANEGIVLLECANGGSDGTTLVSGYGAGLRWAFFVEREGFLACAFSDGAAGATIVRFGNEARIVAGVPNHVVLRKNGTAVEVFINGSSAGTGTVVATGNGTGDDVNVGRSLGTPREHAGAVASTVLWDTNLTDQEISDLYDLYTVTVGDTPVAGRAPLAGTAIDFSGPEYLTQAISANTTYTLSNAVLGKVINLDLDVTGTPTVDLTGADFIRKDTVTAGRMVLKIECIDEDAPTYLATLSDTV